MSLIITLPADDGIVFGSVMQKRHGQILDRETRICQLTERICWSAVGEEALIERIGQALGAIDSSKKSLRELIAPIGNLIKTAVRDFLAMDFRTDIYLNNINAVAQLHRADFVFAESGKDSITLHMNATGSPRVIVNHPFIIGNGDVFAGALLKKYLGLGLDIKFATLLTCRLLDETIESGAFGVMGPIDIWQITSSGIIQNNEEHISELLQTVKTIRENEVAIFEKHEGASLSH